MTKRTIAEAPEEAASEGPQSAKKGKRCFNRVGLQKKADQRVEAA